MTATPQPAPATTDEERKTRTALHYLISGIVNNISLIRLQAENDGHQLQASHWLDALNIILGEPQPPDDPEDIDLN